MGQVNFKQIKAIEAKNKQRIKAICPGIDEGSGIYVFYRFSDGIKHGYVGQAKHLLTRLAQHLDVKKKNVQHIDLSIKKHGLHSEDNPTGYQIWYTRCTEDKLDELEQMYILKTANSGYQLKNKTTGSQGSGKKAIDDTVRKGYQEGLHNGREKTLKEIGHIVNTHLVIAVKKPGNKIQEKALQKLKNLINIQE